MRYQMTITGRTPLLMHFNNIEARDEIAAKGHQGGKPGDDRTPADRWKASLYLDEKLGVCLPVDNILASLMCGGKKVSIGRMKTLKEASQMLYFDNIALPVLVNGKAISKADIDAIDGKFTDQSKAAAALGFRLFVKPVRVGTASHVRVRPRFDSWSAVGEFETDEPALLESDSRMTDLFFHAGRAGLCDWRPSSKKPGSYGIYEAVVKPLKK